MKALLLVVLFALGLLAGAVAAKAQADTCIVAPRSHTMHLMTKGDRSGIEIPIGSEIRAYVPSAGCVGSALVTETGFVLTIRGREPLLPHETGANRGEPVTLRLGAATGPRLRGHGHHVLSEAWVIDLDTLRFYDRDLWAVVSLYPETIPTTAQAPLAPFRVWPNPARPGQARTNRDAEVYDVLGRLVARAHAGQRILSLSPGLYLVRERATRRTGARPSVRPLVVIR